MSLSFSHYVGYPAVIEQRLPSFPEALSSENDINNSTPQRLCWTNVNRINELKPMESSAEFSSDSFICHIHFSALQWWAWERRWDSCGLWSLSVPRTEKRNSGQTRNTNILLLRHKQFYCSDNVRTFSLLQKFKTRTTTDHLRHKIIPQHSSS